MIVDNNEIVIAIDGDYSAIRGIHTAHLSWSGEYVVDQIQTVTERNENYNFCYLSAKDIVLWSNAGDIFYSMKYGTEWQTPENISNSIGNSQFPNGINYYSGFLNRKLFLVWTEAANNQFYLVRHSFNLPEGVPPGGALGKDQKLENKFWFKVAGSNPIVRKTNIQFNTPLEQMVVIKLYDVTGRLVSDIYNQRAARGITSVALPVDNLSNGIYFLRVTTPSENYVEKLVITR
jgi:hypothetical protein